MIINYFGAGGSKRIMFLALRAVAKNIIGLLRIGNRQSQSCAWERKKFKTVRLPRCCYERRWAAARSPEKRISLSLP